MVSSTQIVERKNLAVLMPYAICGLAAFFYFYEFFLRVMPSAITQELMLDFSIGAIGLGTLQSMFYWGYTPMQIPAGLLLDRFGPRIVLSISVLCCALSTWLFGLTSSMGVASITRLIIGISSSFAYLGALILTTLPLQSVLHRSLVQVLGRAGALLGLAPVAAAVSAVGWRQTTFCAALICGLLALLMWLIIRDTPTPNHPTQSKMPFNIGEQLKLRVATHKFGGPHCKPILLGHPSLFLRLCGALHF